MSSEADYTLSEGEELAYAAIAYAKTITTPKFDHAAAEAAYAELKRAALKYASSGNS